MLNCMSKPNTKYAELLIRGPQGNPSASSSQAKAIGGAGYYELHLFIQQTRGLINPGDSNDSLNPVIQIEAFGQKRHSKTKKNTGTAMTYWGEHFFFVKKMESTNELETHKLRLEVFHDKMLGSDALVGDFELDILNIYQAENHCILHKWLALSNFDKGLKEIKGYILISANVISDNDEAFELTDYQPSEQPGSEPQVMIPPHLETKPWQMKISLIRAEELVKMDLIGSIDCFLEFFFAGAHFRTEIIKDNRNPVWGANIYLPYSEPSTDDLLKIKIYDFDMMTKDELVGICSLKKQDILEGKHQDFAWLNIYGSQTNGDKINSEKMNQFPDLGSTWKGRILLSAVVYEIEKPKLCSEKMDSKIVSQYSTKNIQQEYYFIAEVVYGEGYPSKNERYSIEIKWANHEMHFQAVSQHKGLWLWTETKKMMVNFPSLSDENLPDIFVYLKNLNKKISFHRIKVKSIMNKFDQNIEMHFFQISKDKYPELTDDKAGYVKMRVVVGRAESLGNFDINTWKKPEGKIEFTEALLYVHIYNAKNLISADDNGLSDPYLLMEFNGVQAKSETLHKTINPVWNTTILMRIPFLDLNSAPPLNIKMFDWDAYSEDDLIGLCYLDLKKCLENGSLIINQNRIPTPKWNNLDYSMDLHGGTLLLAFNLFINNSIPASLPNLLPPYEKYNVKIKALGVRGLQKVGIYPIKKPLIVINADSIRDSTNKINLPEKSIMIAEAKNYGPDANFSTIINFSVDLPQNSLFWPNLSCLVKNSVWKSEIEPLLGSFVIDLSEAGKKTKMKFEEKLVKQSHKQALYLERSKEVSPSYSPCKSPRKKAPLEASRFKSEKSYTINVTKSRDYVPFVDEIETQRTKPQTTLDPNFKKTLKDELNDPQNQKFLSVAGSPAIIPSRSSLSLLLESDPIVIKASYVKVEGMPFLTEENVPDLKKYYPLGYDLPKNRLNPELTQKHYRLLLENKLENSPYMDHHIFEEFVITRGQRAVNNSLFNKLLGIDEEERALGIFKCFIEVLNEKDKKTLEITKSKPLMTIFEKDSIMSASSVQNKNKSKKLDLDKEFMQNTSVIVRVHILEVFNLIHLESEDTPNPYIEVCLGEQIKSNEKEYKKEVTAAEFYSTFEFQTTLPGSCLMQVKIMDHRDLSSDKVIGETLIDLENRWFSKKWRKLKDKPVETRDVFSPICSIPTGRIRLFVEIFSTNDKLALKNSISITPKPSEEFELRCVIWEIDDCPSMDITDTSDYFVTATVGDITQKTDIHWQAQKGYGSFNWRLIFPIALPNNNPSITFQIWDKDLVGSDDYISAVSMDFSKQAREAFENDTSIKIYGHSDKKLLKRVSSILNKNDENQNTENNNKNQGKLASGEKFDLYLSNVAKDGYTLKNEGKITISFELVPPKTAKANPVGIGRSEPNTAPYCPPPKGRLKFSLNPFTMFDQIFGPKVRMKICVAMCCLICLALFASMVPMIASSLSADFISEIF